MFKAKIKARDATLDSAGFTQALPGSATELHGGIAAGSAVPDFPSTRYQGSKRKIIPWLGMHLRDLDFTSALDVLGALDLLATSSRGWARITYNDYLRFNHLIGLALIENDETVLTRDRDRPCNDFGGGSSPWSGPHRVPRGVLHGQGNLWIDNVVTRIRGLDAEPSGLAYKQALLYYALFQSCLIKRPFNLFHRRNLYLRLPDVKRQFGNKYSWEKSFNERFIAFCIEANKFVFKGARPCRALCYNASDIPAADYADLHQTTLSRQEEP